MVARIIDGVKTAAAINEETAKRVAAMARCGNVQPGLAVVLVGDDPASAVYVRMKEKKCAEIGIFSVKIQLPADSVQERVLEVVDGLNRDSRVHGILVQSPPPPHIDERAVIEAISPAKDVDCFHPVNVGKMVIDDEYDGLLPCTPYGVVELLRRHEVDPAGKHVVVVGRSNIVGKPLALLLARKAKGGNATVTICHSRTSDLAAITRSADILIAAIGKPEFITAAMVAEGAVVVDVGVNRVADPGADKKFRLVGDVAYEEVAAKASMITPVPGGVGPMTIAMLMRNTVLACQMATAGGN